MINTVLQNNTAVISVYSFAEVIENTVTKQKSLHAINGFEKGCKICNFSAGQVFTAPNYLTVQTGLAEHITLVPQFLQYTNHSCDPNIFFDTHQMEIMALKNIEPGDELCFFYPSTELYMAQSFICYCGSKDCLQNVRGAKHLPATILSRYRFTDFIKKQLKIT